MTDEEWRWRRFDELTVRELHDLLKLRCDVFVVEQACAFAEIDGQDPAAFHLLRREAGFLAGCLRVFAPERCGEPARIGRIATSPAHRGTGLGHRMMGEALDFCAENFAGADIVLSAQSHLQLFYGKHGFQPVSETYLEDDIPHVDMRRHAGAAFHP
ncbi:acetyltransferase [Aureimonas ureilytica]|uniref:Acetyltransferase n=1 Tax=Aureimonas ureilytica TaxID=401562 RepID=A0A175R7J0_9HYPH|nr:GNAT family N-acetyltransferase [Aureimonas ureilytica]KTQ94188.1 acetyltransferase [Aureimonas ureilytica]